MQKVTVKMIWYLALLIIGIALFVLADVVEVLDSFWSGMGIGFVVISAIRLVQIGRYKKNPSYAKKLDVQHNDERNHFLATKARSNALYYSILVEAVVMFVLFIIDMQQIAQVISFIICGQVVIYWITYMRLKTKY